MANKASFKALQTSRSETASHVDSNDVDVMNTEEGQCTGWEEIGKPDALQECSSFDSLLNASSSAFECSSDAPHTREELDSPTLVPCNSPAVTPSHSFTKVAPRLCSFPGFPGKDVSPTAASPGSECLSPELSFFNISLISDISEEDDDFQLSSGLDGMFPTPSEIPRRSSLASSSRNVGLGFSGLPSKDSGKNFDGLGLVSVHATNWRSDPSSSLEDSSDSDYQYQSLSQSGYSSVYGMDSETFPLTAADSTEGLSTTFLHEALLTFTEDPFHAHNVLGSIPECRSWYEIDDMASESSPVPFETSESYEYDMVVEHQQRGEASPRKSASGYHKSRRITHTTFSSATISSELKRSASESSRNARLIPGMGVQSSSRPRSTTWPTRSMNSSYSNRRHGMGKAPEARRMSPVPFVRDISSSRTQWRV